MDGCCDRCAISPNMLMKIMQATVFTAAQDRQGHLEL